RRDFQTLVEANGGTYKDAVNGKTDLVVLGSLDRERSSKSAATWTGSTAEKAVAEQRGLSAREGRPLRELSFLEFVADYELEADVEPMLCTARFPRAKASSVKFVKAKHCSVNSRKKAGERTKGAFLGVTVAKLGPDGGHAKGLYLGKGQSYDDDDDDEEVW
ncbi:hypothetical protein TeGR_g183, partial [Tetraparma gracilis]